MSYCQSCDRWFSGNNVLNQHLANSSPHRIICKPCDREFVSEAARTAHWQQNAIHMDTYCFDCEQNYDTEEEAVLHFTVSVAHKGKYDARCNRHFDNAQERIGHMKASAAIHNLCVPCDLDYATSPELITHWKQNECHKGLYDARRNILFETSGSKITHHIVSPEHNVCHPCNLDYVTLHQLQNHWGTTEVHSYTYDTFCQINFANPQLLFSHKKVTPDKHHMCLPCALDYRTHEELKSHMRAAEAHKDSYCSICELDFGSVSNLKLHVPVHRPKPLTCYSCGDQREYPSISALYVHLENGSCVSGWSIQQINNLISRSPGSSSYVIKEREPWLLAGPPKLLAQDSDRDPTRNCWRCPICKKPSFLSKPDLTRHLQEKNCYQKYPNVLKCTECLRQFTKFSNLLQHIEDDNCLADVSEGIIAGLLEHMKVNLIDPSTQHSLSNFQYELQSDSGRSRKLIVKVASITDLISFDR